MKDRVPRAFKFEMTIGNGEQDFNALALVHLADAKRQASRPHPKSLKMSDLYETDKSVSPLA